MKQFLNFNRILVLSPHPDDVEYSISGMMMTHPGTSFDVLNMTKGGDFDVTTFASDRLKEVENFWSDIDNVNVFFTDAAFMKSKQEDEWVNYIETQFDISSYDAILTTNDIDSHFEHRQVCNIATAVCRVSKISIIEYSSPSTLVEWVPNYFVDIKEGYQDKLKKLKMFTSQQSRKYFQPEQIRGFHTNFQASKRGLEIIEMFRIRQIYG